MSQASNERIMKDQLERHDLQYRDGIALILVYIATERDPFRRPLGQRDLLTALGRELDTEFSSLEIVTRVVARLRRTTPPLLAKSEGNTGTRPDLIATPTGKSLAKQWLENGVTLRLLGPSAG